MATTQGVLPRDANNVAVQRYGLQTSKTVTLTGNGTVALPLFHVTGSVLVNGIYGVVTTALGSNVTAAYWRLNDQTAQVDISLATGTTISSAQIGSTFTRRSTVGVALSNLASSAGTVSDPVAAAVPDYFMPFVLIKNNSAVTDIEFVYTTNNSSAGVIKFYVNYTPLSDNGSLDPA